jgi:hypothetical protein
MGYGLAAHRAGRTAAASRQNQVEKEGVKLQSSGTARGGHSRKGGTRGVGGVARERREEKWYLVPFVLKRLTRRGGGKGGSSAGVTREGERGGVWHRRGAQRGRGSTEQKPRRGEDGGVWAAREVEERGWRVWVACAGVGRPRKGGSWAGPESNSADFDLK